MITLVTVVVIVVYGLVLDNLCIFVHVRLLDFCFKYFSVVCAYCIFGLWFLSKPTHACIMHVHVGYSMCMHAASLCIQACACACIPMP